MVKQWRFVGFDDGFSGFESRKACIIGCITAGAYVECFLYDTIDVDGFDSSEKIISMVRKSRFYEQIKCIFLPGITFAGFNVADIVEINERTSIPVVVIMKKRPDFERLSKAIENVSMPELRKEVIKKAGDIHMLEGLYVQFTGCCKEDVRAYIRASRFKGNTPECLRIAHLVASAIAYGESKKT